MEVEISLVIKRGHNLCLKRKERLPFRVRVAEAKLNKK